MYQQIWPVGNQSGFYLNSMNEQLNRFKKNEDRLGRTIQNNIKRPGNETITYKKVNKAPGNDVFIP